MGQALSSCSSFAITSISGVRTQKQKQNRKRRKRLCKFPNCSSLYIYQRSLGYQDSLKNPLRTGKCAKCEDIDRIFFEHCTSCTVNGATSISSHFGRHGAGLCAGRCTVGTRAFMCPSHFYDRASCGWKQSRQWGWSGSDATRTSFSCG